MEQEIIEKKDEKKIELGKFKTKEKFTEFVSFRQGINLISKEATITGDQLAMDLEGKKFKITIKDSGTVDFEEVLKEGETPSLTGRRIQNLIDMICDDAIVMPYRDRFSVNNYKFVSIKEDEKIINLRLCIEVKKPIDKLKDILSSTDITEKQSNKLDSILSFFDKDEETVAEAPVEKDLVVEEKKEENSKENYSQKMMNDSLNKMKEEKLAELNSRLENNIKEAQKTKGNIRIAEKSLKNIEEDIRLTQSRLDSMILSQPANGYIFNVSEEIKHDIEVDGRTKEIVEKLAPLLKINAEAVIDYLTEGKYFIRLAEKNNFDLCKFKKDDEGLKSMKKFFENETISKIEKIDPFGKWSTDFENDKVSIVYSGELKYHDLIEKMIKIGFEREYEFDKLYEKDKEQEQPIMNDKEVVKTKAPDLTVDPKKKTLFIKIVNKIFGDKFSKFFKIKK